MNSRQKCSDFIQSISLWVEQTHKRIKRSTHLADWEKSGALESLNKYSHTLQSYAQLLAPNSHIGPEAAERLLSYLLGSQRNANRIAAFYELPFYSSMKDVNQARAVDLTIINRYMAPYLEPKDKILCLPIDRSEFFNFRGLGVLVRRKHRATPRAWWVGRIEPIQKRLIRLNFDNKDYSYLDRAVPSSEVVMLYKVVEINRAIL